MLGNEETQLTLAFGGEEELENGGSWRRRELGRVRKREVRKWRGRWGIWMVTPSYLYPLNFSVKFFHFDPAFRLRINFKNPVSPEIDLK
jgi:hypothetical protein